MAAEITHEGVNEWIILLVKVESGDLTSTLVRVTRMLTATALMTMQLILQRIFYKGLNFFLILLLDKAFL